MAATATSYPSGRYASEVSVWLQMSAYESSSSFGQNAGARKADFKGEPKKIVRLLAPQTIEDNHGQRYTGSSFKAAAVIEGNVDMSTISAAAREIFGGVASVFVGDIGKATLQTGSNPYEQKIYEAPDFRTFTFRWEFAPLSSTDSTKLGTIIKTLVKASYPIKDGAGIWKFPDQFKLQFLKNSGAGSGSAGMVVDGRSTSPPSAGNISVLPIKFGKCVLTNVATNYTGAGQFRLNENGTPAFINLSLTFSETSLKDQGFFGDGDET